MAHLPLKGIRVVDMCVIWAGPFASVLLGDLGAEVIKPENPFTTQPITRVARARGPKEVYLAGSARHGGFPNNDPGPRPWNYSPGMVQIYRNKKSFTVDIRRPEGMDILRRLVATSDVFIENNATETMEKMGITYDWLRSIKEDIIMVRMPAYGSDGPYANARALGVHLESVMGHTLLRGYRDLDASSTMAVYSADYVAGTQGALATLMAVWHRKRTGRGQLVEVAQAENASPMLAQALMDYSLNRRVQTPLGNRSIYDLAPYGVYPCRPEGPTADGGDRWITITVTNDDEWDGLKAVMGNPDWAAAAELGAAAGRVASQDLLDGKLSEWTVQHDHYDLFHRLQAAGVPAAPVLPSFQAMDDPQVQARGVYQPLKLFDDIGIYRYMTPFFRFPETPSTIYQPPVAMGEHNDYVYREVIGVDDEEYERLKQAGHITMDYDPSVP